MVLPAGSKQEPKRSDLLRASAAAGGCGGAAAAAAADANVGTAGPNHYSGQLHNCCICTVDAGIAPAVSGCVSFGQLLRPWLLRLLLLLLPLVLLLL